MDFSDFLLRYLLRIKTLLPLSISFAIQVMFKHLIINVYFCDYLLFVLFKFSSSNSIVCMDDLL